MKSRTLFTAAITLLAIAPIALAHPGHPSGGGFAAGIYHPISGIDHILAMIAVGLCAAQLGGRAMWFLPAMFLSFMIGGGLLAADGARVPMVEQGIAASVLVLGLLVVGGKKVGMPIAAVLVGAFAIFHGYAHGAEMRPGLSPASYAAGFVIATGLLHAAGIGIGVALEHTAPVRIQQVTGAAIALCGLALFWM